MAEPFEQRPDVKKLLSKGIEQKYLTPQEILEVFPEIESNVEEIDALYRRLLDMGIQVAEPGELGEEEIAESAEEDLEVPAEDDLAVLPLTGPELTSDPVRMWPLR